MTRFCWMSVTIALILFTGKAFSAVDQSQLANLVDEIWKRYKENKMFSVAVSIPKKENMDQIYDINQCFSGVDDATIKKALKEGKVFNEGTIKAARVKKIKREYVHAKYRVLTNCDALLNRKYDTEHDLLLFFVLGSPCYHKCTNENDPKNIIKYLKLIKRWKHYAFVFSYTPNSKNPKLSVNEDQLREALEKLGNTLGLQNIFHCVKLKDHMQCRSCSHNNQVAQYCVSDTDENGGDENRGKENGGGLGENRGDENGEENRGKENREKENGGKENGGGLGENRGDENGEENGGKENGEKENGGGLGENGEKENGGKENGGGLGENRGDENREENGGGLGENGEQENGGKEKGGGLGENGEKENGGKENGGGLGENRGDENRGEENGGGLEFKEAQLRLAGMSEF
ncbi:uncharacterized protein LOC125010588 [Mugil cephalus]|uniref:uncharacterized protein LOC125010588 n=1 Tax=Mugil cephalus TaxID=48193 RepID=UPI001FB7C2BD|nr:uncharacterized protein LOC125010588 [Mugil cephalus]